MTSSTATLQRAQGPAARSTRRENQRGIATVLVLMLILVLTFLAVHITTITQVTAREAQVNSVRSRQRFVAESAADQAFWQLLNDRRTYPNRALGGEPDATRLNDKTDAWLADSRLHLWDEDDFAVQVQVVDAESGLDVTGGASLTAQLQANGGKLDETLDRLQDEWGDATDADDAKRLHGRENSDYAADGWPELPRNAPMRVAEELLWLPAFAGFLTAGRELPPAPPELAGLAAGLRVIPPRGFAFPRKGMSSLFNTPPELMARALNLQDGETGLIRNALAEWRESGRPLAETLPPDLLARLQNRYSTTESGVCTFKVTVTGRDGQIQSRLVTTRDARSLPAAIPQGPVLMYWQFQRP